MGYLLLVLCLFFLFYKFDKTVCCYVAFYPLMSMIGLTNSINLFQALSIFAFLNYITFYRHKYRDKVFVKLKFPFYLTLVFYAISFLISNIGNNPHWPTTIALFFSEYLFLIVFWELMWDDKNRRFFFHCFSIFIFIVCVYCIFEFLMQKNPLYDWYVKSSLFIGYDANRTEDIRFGSMRCHSIMRDVGAMGTICCIAICLFFSKLMNSAKIQQKEKFKLEIMILLCSFCTFLTGTRTVIFALALCFFIITLSLDIKKKIKIIACLLLVIIAFFDYFNQIILSFIDTHSVEGSSTYMRELQMAIVLNVFEKSPIYGLGLEGSEIIINKYTEAYGLESIWFQLIINYGILGVVAFIVSLVQGFYNSIKYKNVLSFTVVAIFFLVKTMFSIPGIGSGYFLYIVSFLIITKNKFKLSK